jgi:hypothetical protein
LTGFVALDDAAGDAADDAAGDAADDAAGANSGISSAILSAASCLNVGNIMSTRVISTHSVYIM